ncbi:MAG: hypothetical protein JWP83_6073, partial [Mycobacterium sp.]|nr:hypothetical protein [Mycobacterium sp.]
CSFGSTRDVFPNDLVDLRSEIASGGL